MTRHALRKASERATLKLEFDAPLGGKKEDSASLERFFGRHILKGNLPTLTMRVSLSPDISKWSRFRGALSAGISQAFG